MFDYIIIGGGISGLYMNYLLRDKNTLLLEKNSCIDIKENFNIYCDQDMKKINLESLSF